MNSKSLILLLAVALTTNAMQMPTFLRRAKSISSIRSSAVLVVASADQQSSIMTKSESSAIHSPPTTTTTTAHQGITRICFVGATENTSNPIPRADTKDLVTFFAKHRDCFLTADNAVVKQLPGGLLQMEKTVGFPGLKVCSTTVILVEPCCSSGGHGFTFELMDCGLSANGAPPLVWLFRQLMRDDDNGSKMVNAKSITTLSVHHTSPEESIFVSNSQIEIQIHIPEMLKRRLGSTRMSALEEQGSHAIQQFLEREFEAAHERLHAAYMDFWRENNAD
jgi:hypothetical protein